MSVDNIRYMPGRKVRERYGVTEMSLWRWERDTKLAFPKPMRVGRYKYWSVADLEEWERRRKSA